MRTNSPHPAFIVAAVAAFIMFGCLLTLAVKAVAGPTQHPRTCFSARSWSADDGLRPCVQVTRVMEDGSFHFQVQDANGTVRYGAGIGALDR